MKSFVTLLAVVAVVAADVSHLGHGQDAEAVVLQQEVDVRPDGFSASYETSNGIGAQESGALKNVGTENEALFVQGNNHYTAPNGEKIELTYIADENGYQPQGAHLPTPPAPEPIPDYIQRSLEYIRTHPPKPEAGQKY